MVQVRLRTPHCPAVPTPRCTGDHDTQGNIKRPEAKVTACSPSPESNSEVISLGNDSRGLNSLACHPSPPFKSRPHSVPPRGQRQQVETKPSTPGNVDLRSTSRRPGPGGRMAAAMLFVPGRTKSQDLGGAWRISQ